MTIKVSLGKRKQYFGKIEMLRCNKKVSITECRLCVLYFWDDFLKKPAELLYVAIRQTVHETHREE